MLALIIVVCIAAITTLGSNANNTFSFVGSVDQGPAKPLDCRLATDRWPVSAIRNRPDGYLLITPTNTLECPMRSIDQEAWSSFLKKEDGPTAVEYAVMLALIIVVCIAAITTLGSNANETFSFVGSSIKVQ